jgi:hypothetical protein
MVPTPIHRPSEDITCTPFTEVIVWDVESTHANWVASLPPRLSAFKANGVDVSGNSGEMI